MARIKLVTLKLPSDTLRKFPVPTIKKKIEQTPKRPLIPKQVKKSSPTPDNSVTPQPTGSKTGFGRNAISEDRKLDKTGKSVRKWVKKPLNIQSFTGYSITFKAWTGESNNKVKKEEKPLKIKITNKNLSLIKKNPEDESLISNSRDHSPNLDDNSSIMSTPEVSAVSTPVP